MDLRLQKRQAIWIIDADLECLDEIDAKNVSKMELSGKMKDEDIATMKKSIEQQRHEKNTSRAYLVEAIKVLDGRIDRLSAELAGFNTSGHGGSGGAPIDIGGPGTGG